MAVQIRALALAALVGLGGCQITASRDDQAPASALGVEAATARPDEALSATAYVSRAIERLQVGDAARARGDLQRALALKPQSRTAKTLLAQLDADPKKELGTKYFEYEAQTGDSLSIIAQKFLGDSLKFYILARYNDLDDPSKLNVGQTVKVPGTAKSRERRSAATQARKPASESGAATANSPPAAAPKSNGKSPERDYELAKAHCSNGKYQQAIKLLEVNLTDKASRELLALCYGAYAQEKASADELGQARAMLVSAVALDPSNRELSTRLATIDDHLEAQKLYRRGVSELRSGQLESSLDSLNQALVFQPDYPKAMQKRNLVRTRLIDGYLKEADDAFTQQKFDEAIAAWDQVLVLDPGNATATARRNAAMQVKAKL